MPRAGEKSTKWVEVSPAGDNKNKMGGTDSVPPIRKELTLTLNREATSRHLGRGLPHRGHVRSD